VTDYLLDPGGGLSYAITTFLADARIGYRIEIGGTNPGTRCSRTLTRITSLLE
jgi:hypothetical protein